MFDFCLAPDTNGDGTGCDNMTCVIIVFKDLQSSSMLAAADSRTSSKRKVDTGNSDHPAEGETEPKRPRQDVETT